MSNSICPASAEPCVGRQLCDRRCVLLHAAPLDEMFDGPSMVHFVGFRGDEFHAAVRAFGQPDFVHRVWDTRAAAEVAPHDRVVFARFHDCPPTPWCFDDSNQADDPAAQERR
jgi:hypothetical protein